MKKILAVILCIFSIFSLGGCLGIKLPELSSCDLPAPDPNAGLITSGDFMYKIEGKGTEDESARIIKLSKEGFNKEILIIPEKLDGYEVRYLSEKDMDIYGGVHYNPINGNYKKIYIPSTVIYIDYYAFHGNKKVNEYVLNIDKKYRPNDNPFYNPVPPCKIYLADIKFLELNYYDKKDINVIKANLQYEYNIKEVSKKHWIDNIVRESKLTPPPTEPKRAGYTFGGWYKEKDCINKWNFETDVTKTMVIEDGQEITEEMQEREDYATILYAKWIAA